MYGASSRDPAVFTEAMQARRVPAGGFARDSLDIEGYVRSFARRRRDELLAVQAAIRRLPARQRAVVVLRYHEDLPEREVARLLRIPVGTVKSSANRALTRLRRDLRVPLADRADSGRSP